MSKLLGALSYMGGKQKRKLNEWIRSHLPENYNQIYIEPFAGMASILLNRPRVSIEVLNDLDNNIYSFWKALRDNSDEFLRQISLIPSSRMGYERAIDKLYLESDVKRPTTMERAVSTYIILTHSTSKHLANTGGYEGFIGGRKSLAVRHYQSNYPPKLALLVDRIKDVELENKDAYDIIKYYSNVEYSVMYIDPPYQRVSKYSYDIQDMPKFKELLKQCKGYIAISGFKNDYDDLGWDKYEFHRKSGFTSVSYKKVVECIWTNR